LKKYIAPLGLIALLLTGCAGGEATPAETAAQTPTSQEPTMGETPVVSEPSPLPVETTEVPQPTVTGPGTYGFESGTGAIGTIAVPAETPPLIEELRQLVDGPETTFVAAEVDNRAGTEEFIFYELWVYDPAGTQYVYADVSEYLSELRDLLPEDAPAETYNRFIDASNELSGDSTQPLQSRTILLTGEPVPAEITGVQISTGYDQVPATFEE
jgi:hypothetical protein